MVDFLRDPKTYGALNKDSTLDVRRPVIMDMSDRSKAIAALNDPKAVANLPSNIPYGEIIYSRVDLGVLTLKPAGGYSVFHTLKPRIPTLTERARTFILGAGNTPASFPGDGLIPTDNQHFTELPGFPAPGYPPAPAPATGQNTIMRLIVTGEDVVHTDAPSREANIRSQLRQIVPTWFP